MGKPRMVPYLTVSDARAAIEFYRAVFGADVVADQYHEMDDGRIGHATLQIDDAQVYLSDEYPELGVISPTTLGATTVAMVLDVDDADETFERALAAGATMQQPVENAHGGRSGWFVDPWGHRWSPFGPEKP